MALIILNTAGYDECKKKSCIFIKQKGKENGEISRCFHNFGRVSPPQIRLETLRMLVRQFEVRCLMFTGTKQQNKPL